MNYDEMKKAVVDAEDTLKMADRAVTGIAYMLRGRLRKVNNTWTLDALKKELKSYNMTTGSWKD